MSIKKLTAAALAAAASATLAAAVPEISGVTMTQSATRLVTINYTLADAPAVVTLDVQTNANTSAAADDPGWTSIGGEALWNAKGDVWRKVGNDLAEGQTFAGTIAWHPDRSWPDHKIAAGGARAVVTAWALDNTPDYMAVDITAAAQPNTQTYYPAADFVPGGVTNADYKTSVLLMRKIMAKDVTWTMGSTTLEAARNAACEATHRVTLTNNYYFGVYEVTQAQWDLIQPNRPEPSYFNNLADRAMRPVEQVSYNEIRNAANSTTADTDYDWPAVPNPGSFLGLLRTKSGLDFDLPSDAQWEFAARAGNGDTKWGDGSVIMNTDNDANMGRLGRYKFNCTSTAANRDIAASVGGTAIVGSYAPNAWGLYDVYGNVWEFCLDRYADDITALNGAVNTVGLNFCVVRGGCYMHPARYSRPAFRIGVYPEERSYNYIGFRVVCTAGLR